MSSNLRSCQLVMLEMLKKIDEICNKHSINYMLFAGTALGAVKYSGFIPWDDDLDIIMLREEYDRFLQIAETEFEEDEFFLQKEFSKHWPLPWSKLRRNNTAYIEKYYPKDKEQHQGIYVDIFPIDNLSDNKIKRKIQFFASKIVIAKSLYKRGYLTNSFIKKAFIQLCRLLPSKPFIKLVKNVRESSSKMVHSFFGGSSAYNKNVFTRKIVTDSKILKFEDAQFPVSKRIDELLTQLYGDYKQPPPEKQKQYKSHAMLIDTENSYEKYYEWQLQQEIKAFTRSIR